MSDEQTYGRILSHLNAALHLAEGPHIDNTGLECSVKRGRDDCCSFCAAAEAVRLAMREVGVNAVWRDGQTALFSDAEMEAHYAEERRIDELLNGPPRIVNLNDALKKLYPEDVLTALARRP